MKRFRRPNDRGAAFVELAIVIPLILSLMLGVFEFGSAWRESALLTRSTSQAARTVSSLGTNPNADRQALTTIVASIQSTNRLSFEPGSDDRVIVYNARGPDGEPLKDLDGTPLEGPPSDCITTESNKITGVCNIYRADSNLPGKLFSAIDLYESSQLFFESECEPDKNDGWCGADRGWFTSSINTKSPYVGVYIQVSYTTLTGLLGDRKITANAVYQMEPCTVIKNNTFSSNLCPI